MRNIVKALSHLKHEGTKKKAFAIKKHFHHRNLFLEAFLCDLCMWQNLVFRISNINYYSIRSCS